jgi:hypothetical protein
MIALAAIIEFKWWAFQHHNLTIKQAPAQQNSALFFAPATSLRFDFQTLELPDMDESKALPYNGLSLEVFYAFASHWEKESVSLLPLPSDVEPANSLDRNV